MRPSTPQQRDCDWQFFHTLALAAYVASQASSVAYSIGSVKPLTFEQYWIRFGQKILAARKSVANDDASGSVQSAIETPASTFAPPASALPLVPARPPVPAVLPPIPPGTPPAAAPPVALALPPPEPVFGVLPLEQPKAASERDRNGAASFFIVMSAPLRMRQSLMELLAIVRIGNTTAEDGFLERFLGPEVCVACLWSTGDDGATWDDLLPAPDYGTQWIRIDPQHAANAHASTFADFYRVTDQAPIALASNEVPASGRSLGDTLLK
jgi:hypothetical protein